jgi:hypothetical protein
MKDSIKCKAQKKWTGWQGIITISSGESFQSGIIRETKEEALCDAERMREELLNGITGR